MNFSFGKRIEAVDWRKLAAVDLDRLTREMDVKTLQDNIMNVTYCNIEAELGMHAVGFDPNFIKLFNLAQLIIEYLLHSQEYLSSNLETEVKKVQETMQSAEEVRKELEQKTESQNKLKKENKRLKKWVAEYQLMMRAGSSGIHKCPHCAKAFVSQEYLSAHLSRRHDTDTTHMNGFVTKPVEVSPKHVTNGEVDPDKLAMMEEMKHIKERLYATERDLMNERAARERMSTRDKDQVLTDQSKLKEMENNYERWRRQEEDKHQTEMEYLKDSLMQQIQELKIQSQEEKQTFSQAISDLKSDMSKFNVFSFISFLSYFTELVSPSMIGSIKDEDEPDGGPSGPSKDEIAHMMREQFDQLKKQSDEERQNEMKRLNQKWKTKEEKMKTDHKNEMNKLHELLSQYEDRMKNDDVQREQLKKMIQDREKAVEEQKIVAEQYQQAVKQQPVFDSPPVLKREVTFSEESLERDRVKTPDFKDSPDSLTLYVAANINRSQYRLWRQRAEGSSEWVDKFFFNAYIKPVGPFSMPIYVHSASGSPYWRQCITGSSKPPSNEYRLDYMFYASESPVLGALQLHVLDGGSLPVLRSCVYKSKELPGWKYKGLSFYVMKSNQAVGTLSSSWDGREDSDESGSELEEIEQVNDAMKESLESTLDSKDITSGLSSSEWGTETLQRGEYHPLPQRPEITTHYDHSYDSVMDARQELEQEIEQRFIKHGVQPSAGRLSSQKLEAVMDALVLERKTHSKKIRNFDETRKRVAQEADSIAKKYYKRNAGKSEEELEPRQSSKSPAPRNKPPTMRAAATAVRASTSLQQQQSLKGSTRSSATLSSTGSQDMMTTGDQTFSGTSVTERTLSESEDEDDYSDSEEEVSEWDSTGGISPTSAPPRLQPRSTPANPKVSVRIPTQEVDSDPEEIQPVTAGRSYPQRGKENIRNMANSLERSLGTNGVGKKPVGGVAMPGKHVADDFDDDSDFSLSSSIDEKTKPTRITRAEMNSTGPRTETTPVPAPRSKPQPSPRREVPKQSTSAVEAFSIDDLSDFDDSDLETHHL
ncbi:uncharacterized protein LOC110234179 [Exaiptasia diaphana]|uniref:C2H2-type domain-containing protein n=1 Tax=Exaiptasia diaphana TaxID=2652724 RepID=A0A913YG47_EXADI|nr:uncharacterized protein LOC110234179 [Exaiptasia diaphana]